MLFHLPPIGQLLGVLFPYWELALLADPHCSFLLGEGWGSPTGGKVALFPTFRAFGFSMFFFMTVFSYMFYVLYTCNNNGLSLRHKLALNVSLKLHPDDKITLWINPPLADRMAAPLHTHLLWLI